MEFNIIVAMDKNGLIGNNNQLPWSLPEDLSYFKKVTSGYPIIMGRKTYESIGKPLPYRENIIITRDKNYKVDGCTIIHHVSDLDFRNDTGFVIGGSEIFKLFLLKINKLYITEIDCEFKGDTYFPKINLKSDWNLISSIKGIKNEKNPYDYYFNIYDRLTKKES